MQCKKAQTADAPRQGERPRICCHQRRDTTAQLEGQTLAEALIRKEKSSFLLMELLMER